MKTVYVIQYTAGDHVGEFWPRGDDGRLYTKDVQKARHCEDYLHAAQVFGEVFLGSFFAYHQPRIVKRRVYTKDEIRRRAQRSALPISAEESAGRK